MSAYLMTDQATCAIAFTLVKNKAKGFAHWNPAHLACELRQLNMASLDARYGDGLEWGETIPQVEDEATLKLDAAQLIEELRSFTYQCGEGCIVDTPLFRRLCELIGTDDNWCHTIERDWRTYLMFRQPKETEPATTPEKEPERSALPPNPVQYNLALAYA